MSNSESHRGFQQARTGPEEESKRLEERRKSLEEKTKILEEKAAAEKFAIDKKLLSQILEEENRTHDAAVRELEEKIANMEQQRRPSPPIESTPSQMPPEPSQEISDNVEENVSVGALEPPEQSEVEASQGGSKKRRRGLF